MRGYWEIDTTENPVEPTEEELTTPVGGEISTSTGGAISPPLGGVVVHPRRWWQDQDIAKYIRNLENKLHNKKVEIHRLRLAVERRNEMICHLLDSNKKLATMMEELLGFSGEEK